ncbi:MAG: hypothetical protein OEZ41_06040, partial [Nitrospirota bacterium]|nr:hypothetical protein [Nitrospirota bacterium]
SWALSVLDSIWGTNLETEHFQPKTRMNIALHVWDFCCIGQQCVPIQKFLSPLCPSTCQK